MTNKKFFGYFSFQTQNVLINLTSGEGLFARRKILIGSLIAVYAGSVRKNSPPPWTASTEKAEKEMLHKNMISFNKTFTLDVPRPYDDLKRYKASLGHKANHSFKANAKFTFLNHPR